MADFELIQEVLTASDVTSVTITVPTGTYSHLQMVFQTNPVNSTTYKVLLNNTAPLTSAGYIKGTTTSISSSRTAATDLMVVSSTSTCSGIVNIFHVGSSSIKKRIGSIAGLSSGPTCVSRFEYSLLPQVSSVTLQAFTGSLGTASIVSLYGIRA